MKIPESLLRKWSLLRSHGDNKRISELNEGIIEMDVSRAFSKKECSDDVFEALASFYKDKEELVKQYL